MNKCLMAPGLSRLGAGVVVWRDKGLEAEETQGVLFMLGLDWLRTSKESCTRFDTEVRWVEHAFDTDFATGLGTVFATGLACNMQTVEKICRCA